jgi:hypothetical protein
VFAADEVAGEVAAVFFGGVVVEFDALAIFGFEQAVKKESAIRTRAAPMCVGIHNFMLREFVERRAATLTTGISGDGFSNSLLKRPDRCRVSMLRRGKTPYTN